MQSLAQAFASVYKVFVKRLREYFNEILPGSKIQARDRLLKRHSAKILPEAALTFLAHLLEQLSLPPKVAEEVFKTFVPSYAYKDADNKFVEWRELATDTTPATVTVTLLEDCPGTYNEGWYRG